MSANHYEEYRATKLRTGAEFQDFIMERLHLIGTVLQPLCSRTGQLKGENLFGLEIKHDEKMHLTGNVCIEVAEKARPRDGDYAPSGIFRSDNTWLYGIGDHSVFFIFPKSTLRNLYAKRTVHGLREYNIPTSKGFLIPFSLADRIYARKLIFDFQGGIQEVLCGGEKTTLDLQTIEKPKEFQLALHI